MGKVFTIAIRDFKHTVLTKGFLIGAVGIPVGVMVLTVFVAIFARPGVPSLEGTVAIVDPSGAVADAAGIELAPERLQRRINRVRDQAESVTRAVTGAKGAVPEGPRVELTLERHGADESIDALKDRVRGGKLVALAVFDAAILSSPKSEPRPTFQLFVPDGFAATHSDLIGDALGDAVARARAHQDGLDIDDMRSLIARANADIRRVGADGREAAESIPLKFMLPFAFMFLLWICVFFGANFLLTSTIEEKSNKVVEVLLSAISPMQLMAGKILGQGMVSLLMLALYGGVGIVALIGLSAADLIAPSLLILAAICFVMAYFMIASMMAAVGSAANDMREAQSLIGPAMMIVMLPMMLWFPISQNPNGVLATVMSFVPPMTPFVMVLRLSASNEPIAGWQVAAALIWGAICAYGMVWLAARVFRVGVLMQGKPPTPLELLRWVRYR